MHDRGGGGGRGKKKDSSDPFVQKCQGGQIQITAKIELSTTLATGVYWPTALVEAQRDFKFRT
jgi:hypothetical protein